MSNMITVLPNIVTVVQDQAAPVNNSANTKNTSNYDNPGSFAADPNQSVNTDNSIAASQGNTSDDSGREVNDAKGENFQEVLQRRISNESDKKPSSNEKKDGKTAQTGDEAVVEDQNPVLPNLINIPVQTIAKVLGSEIGAKLADLKKGQADSGDGTSENSTLLHHKIAAISSGDTAKPDTNVSQFAGQVAETAKEQILTLKETDSELTKDQKVKEAVQAVLTTSKEQKTNNIKEINEINMGPEPKLESEGQINPKIKSGAEQLLRGTDIGKKPEIDIKPQVSENAETTMLNHKIKVDGETNTIEEKGFSLQNLKNGEIPEKADVQLDRSEEKQNQTTTNTTQDIGNNAESTAKKLSGNDNIEMDISVRTNNNADVVDIALKSANELASSVNSSQDVNSAITTPKAVAANVVGISNTTGTENFIGSPGEQVIRNIRTSPLGVDREINISLNPPELGRVRITFLQTDGEISGFVQVQKAQTRYDIERSLPQIAASLQESGVQIKRLEVVQDDQSQAEEHRNNNVSDDGTERQEFSGQDDDKNSSRSKQNTSGSTLNSDYQQAKQVVDQISDDAISAYA